MASSPVDSKAILVKLDAIAAKNDASMAKNDAHDRLLNELVKITKGLKPSTTIAGEITLRGKINTLALCLEYILAQGVLDKRQRATVAQMYTTSNLECFTKDDWRQMKLRAAGAIMSEDSD